MTPVMISEITAILFSVFLSSKMSSTYLSIFPHPFQYDAVVVRFVYLGQFHRLYDIRPTGYRIRIPDPVEGIAVQALQSSFKFFCLNFKHHTELAFGILPLHIRYQASRRLHSFPRIYIFHMCIRSEERRVGEELRNVRLQVD